MPLTDQFLKDAEMSMRVGKDRDPKRMYVPQGSETSCDLLARQLEVQIQILQSLERIEEKLK